jgi:uncharacterized RDD family membrane protein YckC
VCDEPERICETAGVTLPPSDHQPDIPGARAWTPEQPAPTFVSPAAPAAGSSEQFALAGWGARFGAYFLDGVFRTVLAVAIAAIGFAIFADHPFSVNLDDWTDSGAIVGADDAASLDRDVFARNNLVWMLASAAGVYVVLALVYAPLFMAVWRGATPGKRVCGIRVIRETGADVGFGLAFVREALVKGLLMNVIASSFFLPWLANYLWPLWDRECRAGHDVMVRTRVIRTRG